MNRSLIQINFFRGIILENTLARCTDTSRASKSWAEGRKSARGLNLRELVSARGSYRRRGIRIRGGEGGGEWFSRALSRRMRTPGPRAGDGRRRKPRCTLEESESGRMDTILANPESSSILLEHSISSLLSRRLLPPTFCPTSFPPRFTTRPRPDR